MAYQIQLATSSLSSCWLAFGTLDLFPMSACLSHTLPILSRLVQAPPTVFASTYRRTMLRGMMAIAFRTYLRVGEMVPRSRNMMQGWLQVGDVTLTGDLINVSFRRFKHSARHGPQSLQLRGECLQGSLTHPAAFCGSLFRLEARCKVFFLDTRMAHLCSGVNSMCL